MTHPKAHADDSPVDGIRQAQRLKAVAPTLLVPALDDNLRRHGGGVMNGRDFQHAEDVDDAATKDIGWWFRCGSLKGYEVDVFDSQFRIAPYLEKSFLLCFSFINCLSIN